MDKIDLDYDNYIKYVKFSSDAYDRHIISVEPSESGFGIFKIGEPFTKEEFIEKIKINEHFRNKWCSKNE